MKPTIVKAFLLACVIFVSCEEDPESEISASITGTWAGNRISIQADPDGIIPAFTVREDSFNIHLQFRTDGTVMLTDKNKTQSGTYLLAGSQLTLNITYPLDMIDLAGTYTVEVLNATVLQVSREEEGTYTHPDTGQRFEGKVKATLYFSRGQG